MKKKRKDDRLPQYVYATAYAYTYKPYRKGAKRPTITLCPIRSPISRVWEEWEKLQESDQLTLGWLLDEYRKSEAFKSKSDATQKEQKRQIKVIKGYKLRSGKTFGEALRRSITNGSIRSYLDARLADGAAVAGNRERAVISAAWNWARERDLIAEPNPCKGVKRNRETARTNYVTDEHYKISLEVATPGYLYVAQELAYLCRMRKSEVLRTTFNDVLEAGIDTRRLKGSKDTITGFTPRLKALVEYARTYTKPGLYLVRDAAGAPVRVFTFNSAWRRHQARLQKKGVVPFPFHDLKAKGVTDFDGDKRAAGGHRSVTMTDRYNRKKEIVDATR